MKIIDPSATIELPMSGADILRRLRGDDDTSE